MKIIIIILGIIIFSIVVIIELLWPRGAPSFNTTKNVVFYIAGLILYIYYLIKKRK